MLFVKGLVNFVYAKVYHRAPRQLAGSLRLAFRRKRILFLKLSKDRKPLASYFLDWITLLKLLLEAFAVVHHFRTAERRVKL